MLLIDLDDDRNCYCGMNGEYENWNIDPNVLADAQPKSYEDALNVNLHVAKISKHCSDFSDLDNEIDGESGCLLDKRLYDSPSAQPENCEGCKHLGKWENEVEYGYPSPCTRCKRRVEDHYER